MFKKIVLFFLCFLQFQLAQASFSMGATRVIYDEGTKGASISIINNSDKVVYLVQSWVENFDETGKSTDFLITPPLSRLDEKQENILKIVFVGDKNNFPKDRESIFWLNIKAIPGEDPDISNRLSLAFNNKIKLFYRPANLIVSPEGISKKISFQFDKNQLIVSNPTPFHITFTSIEADGKKLLDTSIMIAPFDSITLKVDADLRNSKINWRTVNDFGAVVTDEINLSI